MRKKLFYVILLLVVFEISFFGAYLQNVPVTVEQPDGTILRLLATGDEFYNWIHDKEGYTIVIDPFDGTYVYAVKENGKLKPSDLIVGIDDPLLNGIQKYLKNNPEHNLDRNEIFHGLDDPSPAPKTGTINNLVVFIRFSDETEFSRNISPYNTMFNSVVSGYNSMKNYFSEASYNTLSINTSFYPLTATTVLSFQDTNPRAYYKPYNVSTNPTGYEGGDNGTERRNREHTLLKNAVDSISSQVPVGLNLDGDNDGLIDNVCFIVKGGPTGWSSLLWPHKWSLYSVTATINSKRVYTFNFQLETSLDSSGVGVLCHEMFHSIGAPDLYHYSGDGLRPVYTWGLMEYNSNPPRHMLGYMKYRYGNWIASVPEITTAGTYSLNPLTSSSNNCYKISSPFSPSEYFFIEYRKKIGTFENKLPGEGLIVYRINTAVDGSGNRNGPPDEVYIYRPNGTTSVNGSPTLANFSSNSGRTAINDATNPSSFLNDGSSGGLDISNIGSTGGTISFTVNIAGSKTIEVASPNGSESWEIGSTHNISWSASGLTNDIKITLWKDDALIGLIVKDVDPSSGSYSWTVGTHSGGTAVSGSGYKVKIREQGGASFTTEDDSDTSFTLTPGRSITVTSPNGSENWQKGSTHNIGWSASGLTNNVKLTLWKDGSFVGLIVKDINPASGTYSWTAGNYSGGTAAAGTGYKIKIREQGGVSFTTEDDSDASFTLTAARSITVSSPNGGENLQQGSTHNVSWSSSGLTNDIKLTLWKDGSFVGLIVKDVNPASGSYSWTVGNYSGGTAAAGTGYRIKIREQGGALFTTEDSSNASFNISQISVTSPNGGESWQIGTSQNITWNATGLTNNVKITLWKDGSLVGLIVKDINPASGTYSWTVGNYNGGPATSGTGYKIKIREQGGAAFLTEDQSNSTFNLIN